MSIYWEIMDLIEEEKQRQENEICLIASENYMSKDVIDACASIIRDISSIVKDLTTFS